MRLSKFITALFVLTVFSLVYIELQVQIYDFGYKGEKKKVHIQRLTDIHSDLVYNIYKLKSANHIGIKLLSAEDSKMQFIDNNHIIKLETPAQLLESGGFQVSEAGADGKKPGLLAGIFFPRSQAEAEPIK